MTRIPLSQRKLPNYTGAEEFVNTLTHGLGAGMGVAVLVLSLIRVIRRDVPMGIAGALVYGISMICLYTVSSVYHGLKPCTGKKVLQVIDHCTIYLLIAGTYTPIALCSLCPVYPVLGWGMLIFQWSFAALAITLTAIDLKKYNVFSMICYIGLGWAILPFVHQAMEVLGPRGFYLVLAGGIAYTIGAVMYGIGSKKRWMHGVFHIFVLLGSILQFLAIYFYTFV